VQPEIVAAVVTDELRTLWDQRATPVAWL
jgi:hypothetical protein